MLDWVTETIAASGYWGILALMALETVIPPIPSEVIMPLAGFTIFQGKLSFVWVILAGTAGSVLGAIPWYFVGKWVGEHQLRLWIDRYGKWATLSVEDLERSQHWFRHYGNAVVFIGRLIPGIRTYISIPAGLEQMSLPSFLAFSTLGTAVWVTLLTTIGYFLGQNYQVIEQYLSPISGIALTTILVLVVSWFAWRWFTINKK